MVKGRISNGWSLEDALTLPKGTVTTTHHAIEYNGVTYHTIAEACRQLDYPLGLVNQRLQRGWSIERIFSTPKNDNCNSRPCYDFAGNYFSSHREMFAYYHTNENIYASRTRIGFTNEEALTIPKNMSLGEFRESKILNEMGKKYIFNTSIKKLFKQFGMSNLLDEFFNELEQSYCDANIHWSRARIERLRPNFAILTDDEKKIAGLIEIDGEQLFEPLRVFFKTFEQFMFRVDAEKMKQSFLEFAKLPVLRIRHDQLDQETMKSINHDFFENMDAYVEKINPYLSKEEYWTKQADCIDSMQLQMA